MPIYLWLLYPIKQVVGQIWPMIGASYAICPQGLPSLVGGIYMIITVCCGKPCSGGQHGVLLWEPQGGTGRNLDVRGSLYKVFWFCLFILQTWLMLPGKAVPTWTQVSFDWGLCSPWVFFWCYYFPLGSLPCFCGLYPCPPWLTVGP